MNQQQKGFALQEFLIGVVVVLLVGALGFVFWQNYNKDDAAVTDSTDTPAVERQDDDASQAVVALDQKATATLSEHTIILDYLAHGQTPQMKWAT